MPGLFSTEGKFYGALSLAADLVIVNVMMLVAMLPVVTGGAALRAATVVITQLLNNEAGTPVRTFLREFTRKWKVSTVWWFITTALMLFCVLASVSVWFYPLAHMGGVRSTLTHSVQLAFAQPLRTIVGVIFTLSPLLVFAVAGSQLGVVVVFYALIGAAFTQYLVLLALGENAGVVSR